MARPAHPQLLDSIAYHQRVARRAAGHLRRPFWQCRSPAQTRPCKRPICADHAFLLTVRPSRRANVMAADDQCQGALVIRVGMKTSHLALRRFTAHGGVTVGPPLACPWRTLSLPLAFPSSSRSLKIFQRCRDGADKRWQETKRSCIVLADRRDCHHQGRRRLATSKDDGDITSGVHLFRRHCGRSHDDCTWERRSHLHCQVAWPLAIGRPNALEDMPSHGSFARGWQGLPRQCR
jgi:hypothetical protein